MSLKDGEEPQFEVNAQINCDLFVVAARDIKKGEEIFIKCGWEEGLSGMSKESNESSGGGSSASNESEESDGDKNLKPKMQVKTRTTVTMTRTTLMKRKAVNWNPLMKSKQQPCQQPWS